METTNLVKEGREFVIEFSGAKVFVGTAAYISPMAAQLVVHDFMAPLNWRPSGEWSCLADSEGNDCIAVGFKVPLLKRRKAKQLIAKLATA